MLKDVSLLFLMLFSFISCNQDSKNSNDLGAFYKKENASEYIDKITLNEQRKLSFKLDSFTTLNTSDIQYAQSNGLEYLSIFDQQYNIFTLYDINTLQKKFIVNLKTEGPDGTGPTDRVNAAFLWSMDTIVYFNNARNEIMIFNKDAQLLKKISLRNFENLFNFKSKSYCIVDGNLIIFNDKEGSMRPEAVVPSDSIPAALSWNVKTGNFKFLYHRPKVYDKGFNVGWNRASAYGIYNDKSNYFVCSYPQDHLLYMFDQEGKEVSKVFIGSKYFSELKPFDYNYKHGWKLYNNVENSFDMYGFTTPNYSLLHYDQSNDLYYRVAFLPKTKQEYEKDKWKLKPSIIIADNNFSKVGEVLFDDEKYFVWYSFVTKQGLAILRNDLYEADDNQLQFSIFKPEKK